ncbi:MAG: hypothetical protein M3Q65_07580 [Chloroflexota bacterium]|nr:hypothetical protein [Chloroflexota bacterium]
MHLEDVAEHLERRARRQALRYAPAYVEDPALGVLSLEQLNFAVQRYLHFGAVKRQQPLCFDVSRL